MKNAGKHTLYRCLIFWQNRPLRRSSDESTHSSVRMPTSTERKMAIVDRAHPRSRARLLNFRRPPYKISRLNTRQPTKLRPKIPPALHAKYQQKTQPVLHSSAAFRQSHQTVTIGFFSITLPRACVTASSNLLRSPVKIVLVFFCSANLLVLQPYQFR